MTDLERELQYAKGYREGWDKGYQFAMILQLCEVVVLAMLFYFKIL